MKRLCVCMCIYISLYIYIYTFILKKYTLVLWLRIGGEIFGPRPFAELWGVGPFSITVNSARNRLILFSPNLKPSWSPKAFEAAKPAKFASFSMAYQVRLFFPVNFRFGCI